MGPASTPVNQSLYPTISWDMRKFPWTDRRGEQEPYASAVRRWLLYRDVLPAASLNRIPLELREVAPRSLLLGCGVDLCQCISYDFFASKDNSASIFNEHYKRDALSIVSLLCSDFSDLLATRLGLPKWLQIFESLCCTKF